MASGRPGAQGPAPDAAVYVISVAAELTGLHPQTLRTWERMGLVTPGRTGGGGRRYSGHDIDLLRQIAELTSAGVGLDGVRRILDLEHRAAALAQRNVELQQELDATREALRQVLSQGAPKPAGHLAPQPGRLPVLRPKDTGSSVVVWRRDRG